jgi:hypothetical protein
MVAARRDWWKTGLRLGITLLAVVVSAGGLWLAKAAVTGGSRPLGFLPVDQALLGEGPPNGIVVGAFEIWNHGGAPLEFKLTPSCGCAGVSPREGAVPPGSRQPIALAIKLGSDYGDDKVVRVDIETNDPLLPTRQFVARAECPAPLKVVPESLNFGRVAGGLRAPRELVIRGRRGDPLPCADAVAWRLEGNAFEAAPRGFSDGSLTLTVALKDGLPREAHAGALVLSAPDGRTLSIPLAAEVAAPLTIVPRTGYVHRSRAGERPRPVTVIVVRTDGVPLERSETARVPAGWSVEDRSASAGARRILQITPAVDAMDGRWPVALRFAGFDEAAECEIVIATSTVPREADTVHRVGLPSPQKQESDP